jgi:hypothetical protein
MEWDTSSNPKRLIIHGNFFVCWDIAAGKIDKYLVMVCVRIRRMIEVPPDLHAAEIVGYIISISARDAKPPAKEIKETPVRLVLCR